MGYIGMCVFEGYGFQAVYSGIGYINQRAWVQNGVSFSMKQISWLKILVQTRETGNCLSKILKKSNRQVQIYATQPKRYSKIGGIWGVQSSIGQQNSAELALMQAKGSRSQRHIPTMTKVSARAYGYRGWYSKRIQQNPDNSNSDNSNSLLTRSKSH